MISDVHLRLRAATQDHHSRLEDRLDILTRVETRAGRRELVEGFTGLHADAEAALSPWLAGLEDLDFDARRRSTALARDLAVVGGRRPPAAPFTVRSVGEALGVMYVLEGATLGGRVIQKQVRARGGDMRGLSFLDPYGEAVGERWRSFLSVLADAGRTKDAADAMVEGAVAGFEHADRRLCRAAAHG